MTRGSFVAVAVMAGMVSASACTTKNQEAPPLTGPSELDKSIAVSVSPDVLPLDGASQSVVTVLARDAASQPIRNMSLRAETRVGGTPVDFGILSARNIVTGSDGRASLVYTAPIAPATTVDPFIIVDIVVTPIGSDFNNSSERTAAIRLTPTGGVIPPINIVPNFTVIPQSPQVGQRTLFDARTSTGAIAEYSWSFGDGGRGSGQTTQHTYDEAGTVIVTLTVTDGYGRSRSTSQSITVGIGTRPVAVFVFSPAAPRVGQAVNFNASASTSSDSSRIVSYTWDFGDGSPVVTVGQATIAHTFAAAANYNVTLIVTDEAGRTSRGTTTAVPITP